MSFAELAHVFPCGDDELVGVLALPHEPAGSVGVLVVVGGRSTASAAIDSSSSCLAGWPRRVCR